MKDLTPAERHVADQAAAELGNLGDDAVIELHLGPAQAITLLGLLQLVLRHPELRQLGGAHQVALDVAAALERRLAEAGPNVADMARRGWGRP